MELKKNLNLNSLSRRYLTRKRFVSISGNKIVRVPAQRENTNNSSRGAKRTPGPAESPLIHVVGTDFLISPVSQNPLNP